MFRISTALFAVSSVHAQCPPEGFDSAPNFDLESFMGARWWIQEQMSVSYLPATQNRCVYADYSKKDKSIFGWDVQVHNHAEDIKPPHESHDSGKLICANIVDASTGKLEVAPCFLPTFTAGPYWVLEYNEAEGWALISGGPPKKVTSGGCSTGGGVNGSGLWIFTREQQRDEALVQKGRDLAKSKGFDLSVLNKVDNTECTEPPQEQQVNV